MSVEIPIQAARSAKFGPHLSSWNEADAFRFDDTCTRVREINEDSPEVLMSTIKHEGEGVHSQRLAMVQRLVRFE
jgi:hypothetical protein